MQAYIDLLKSRRFVLLVLTALTWVANQPVIDVNTVLTALTGLLSGALTVVVVDKFCEKIGGK